MEDLGGRGPVDIHPFAEGRDQVLVAAEVGHDAQLNLRIVGRNDDTVRRTGHEGFADFAAAFGADGDVLQVRVRRGKPPRGRQGLVEGGVDLPVGRGDIGRERFNIGRKQFLGCPVFQDFANDGMLVGEGQQGGFIGCVLAAGALFGFFVQPEFLE